MSDKDELAATRATLEATRQSIDQLVGHLNDRVDRNRMANILLSVVLLAVAVLSFAGWRDYINDERREEDRQEAACESASDNREIIRDMVRDGGIASGLAGGEALIAVAQAEDPDRANGTIEQYRQSLADLLASELAEVVNRLPDRRWNDDTDECVDVLIE